MGTERKLAPTDKIALVGVVLSVIAFAVLVTFPANVRLWQTSSWTLVAALLVLLVVVPILGYRLIRKPDDRSWQRIVIFLLGLSCLGIVAAGAL